MGNGLSESDRKLINAAIEEGRVVHGPSAFGTGTSRSGTAKRTAPAPVDTAFAFDPFPIGSAPLGPAPRVVRRMGVREALEWAFASEHARLDDDPVATSSGGARIGFGMEFVLMQRAMLGGTAIDTSPGRSTPADDAEMVAAAVQAALTWPMALRVAELARACLVPDAMVGARPRCLPVRWQRNAHGLHGKSETMPRQSYMLNGRVRSFEPRFTPITYAPTASQIASARRAYLDWWSALLSVMSLLRHAPLRWIELTPEMPPLTPWREYSLTGAQP
ncbi:hypothetical protein LX81_00267 [Palleronia aestuarii]|uniref:Uncharacterized protein n=1 Tax=Palleronia aestuarii TaxID=568105 RepID=A0A2W7NHB4_9RHOB|nr:hypothetical protein [Palleronia aestuarii]PZX19805.1 hypothetical protein LX81_00267 [Palleronia aestuarii]